MKRVLNKVALCTWRMHGREPGINLRGALYCQKG